MLKLTILTICLSVAFAASPVGKLPLAGHKNFMEFMLATRDLSQRDASANMLCFDYYVPVLNGITNEYETNYAACMKTADESRSEIDIKTQPDRENIEDSAKSACTALVECTKYPGSIDYFSCFSNTGSQNTKIMSGISFNASEILMGVREQYRLIEDQQNRCTNASERIYVEDTATAYEELQACLQGKAPAPTTTTTTAATEPSTTESTPETEPTEAPEESSSTSTESPQTESTADDNVEGVRSRNYLPIQDSKWRHLLGKLGNHIH